MPYTTKSPIPLSEDRAIKNRQSIRKRVLSIVLAFRASYPNGADRRVPPGSGAQQVGEQAATGYAALLNDEALVSALSSLVHDHRVDSGLQVGQCERQAVRARRQVVLGALQ